MAKRYIPKQPFAIHADGIRYHFSPDYKNPDTGELGYLESQLPKKMPKDQKALFRVVDDSPKKRVEKATAAPGETRDDG